MECLVLLHRNQNNRVSKYRIPCFRAFAAGFLLGISIEKGLKSFFRHLDEHGQASPQFQLCSETRGGDQAPVRQLAAQHQGTG